MLLLLLWIQRSAEDVCQAHQQHPSASAASSLINIFIYSALEGIINFKLYEYEYLAYARYLINYFLIVAYVIGVENINI